ncbi:MAG: transglutaminase family protein, partial [Verrucomicrobiota bacterium]
QAVSDAVNYTIRMEPGVQHPSETLEKGSGSCRDSAWLMVHVMRQLGIAARFCSGYLIQLKADQKPVDCGPAGPAEDFTDLHAWAEIYLPGAGWVGLDPTSGLLAGEGHIPLCSAADFVNAAPLTGALLGGGQVETNFEFDMKVTRIKETPRTTLPYTTEQSKAIEALGHQLDKRLKGQDIRLTMGGEPTFVSATEMEADEWNTDALGPTKERYADQLLRRLYKQWAPGGFLHHGQGKWYPGEPLPRWAYTAYWRPDGQAVWTDPELFAKAEVNYGYTNKESQAFTTLLAENLGLSPEYIRAGFEDLYYYLWKERRLPMNVTVDDPRLEDELERKKISEVFDQGLGTPVGHLLPVARGVFPDEWMTGPWFLGSEEMFLHPGNHPMGYRLPIDGLPWASRNDHPFLEPYDPAIPRQPFPPERLLPPPLRGNKVLMQSPGDDRESPEDREARLSGEAEERRKKRDELIKELRERQRLAAANPPAIGQSAAGQVRTGLCVEPRDGRLNVFFPPLIQAKDYLELVAAVEETAKSLGTPVRIEGYKPPSDPRLASFSVTPDPGVIEVNIHPSTDWSEIVSKTRTLYEEARNCGLGTEKYLQDGRHSGTGGGNHIVVGGGTPLDSPFLRRPDLLRSLITYFNNHPSLSYLFSGMFIGPTSQAPRLDEARLENIYELETAFSALPETNTIQDNCQWLVDRVLRNHLVDMTGNTHRAELCIDKLFSPESTTGRLGLVEMRGFEMPPHPDMSLAQQVLVRGLLSRFWDQPYTAKLERWGTSLHDRWMLPHFLEDDIQDVVEDLNAHDLEFDPAWFSPHLEFRMPLIGELDHRNIHLEVRQAIEPWNVLGEESTSGGMARYVDSSVERVQVKLSNLTETRHVLTCNGVPVPLHPTGRRGEFVAGVRFRAWAPFSALHPTKPINSPLTFDLIDTWNQRSLAACQYHVVHPGGRAYEDFPLNAFVAESRRRSRFFDMGKSPGWHDPTPPEKTADFPLTLDLQRYS